MDLLPSIPVVNFNNEVVDSTNHDLLKSVTALSSEANTIQNLPMNCTLAVYRSRIVHMTYIYNSIVKLINTSNADRQTVEVAERTAEELYDEINSMWEAHNEW